MSITNCRKAVTESFRTGAFFADADVSWPGIPFTPPTNKPWARFLFMPNQPSVATLGSGGQDEANGIVQIDLRYPTNDSTKDIETKAEAIRAVFKAGSRHAKSGTTVVIKSCGWGAVTIVSNYLNLSISIAYYAYITR